MTKLADFQLGDTVCVCLMPNRQVAEVPTGKTIPARIIGLGGDKAVLGWKEDETKPSGTVAMHRSASKSYIPNDEEYRYRCCVPICWTAKSMAKAKATLKQAALGDVIQMYLDSNGSFSDQPTGRTVSAAVIGTRPYDGAVMLGWKEGAPATLGYTNARMASTDARCEFIENEDEYARCRMLLDPADYPCILPEAPGEEEQPAATKATAKPSAIIACTVGDMPVGSNVFIFINEHGLISSTPTGVAWPAKIGHSQQSHPKLVRLDWFDPPYSPWGPQIRELYVVPTVRCIPRTTDAELALKMSGVLGKPNDAVATTGSKAASGVMGTAALIGATALGVVLDAALRSKSGQQNEVVRVNAPPAENDDAPIAADQQSEAAT